MDKDAMAVVPQHAEMAEEAMEAVAAKLDKQQQLEVMHGQARPS